jgi:hypothetical protein
MHERRGRGARRTRSAARGLALLACAACTTVPAPRMDPVTPERALAAWARVLEQHVSEQGQVDFAALARNPGNLERFVDYVARVDPERDAESFPTRDAQIAHLINAYNALSMYGVLRAGIPRTNAGLRKIRFFFLRRYRIAGRSESLHRYESRIRALGEERVHFALNCMSVSCPRLPRVPFTGERLKAELENETRRFFADPRHLQVDAERRTLRVSAILDFYTGDFLSHAGSLIEYINRYRESPIPADYRVEFLPYDWTINRIGAGSPEP